MVKENIGAILQGFQRDPCPAEKCDRGFDIYTVPAWDYRFLLSTYNTAAETARKYHVPALVHVTDVTQPLGHSTSGSQERYKSPERLAWEAEWDCIRKFREWIQENGIADETELARVEEQERQGVEEARKQAWEAYQTPLLRERTQTLDLLSGTARVSRHADELEKLRIRLAEVPAPIRKDLVATVHEALVLTRDEDSHHPAEITRLGTKHGAIARRPLPLFPYLPAGGFDLHVEEIKPVYAENAPMVMGFAWLGIWSTVPLPAVLTVRVYSIGVKWR